MGFFRDLQQSDQDTVEVKENNLNGGPKCKDAQRQASPKASEKEGAPGIASIFWFNNEDFGEFRGQNIPVPNQNF